MSLITLRFICYICLKYHLDPATELEEPDGLGAGGQCSKIESTNNDVIARRERASSTGDLSVKF